MLVCSVHQLAWYPELRQWLPCAHPQYMQGAVEGSCAECVKTAKEALKETAPHLYEHLPPAQPLRLP
jgi:hypothetical protein